LIVQGDATTAFAAALAACCRKVPVAHVESGLRSRDIFNPYPEEVNRRLAAVTTQLHFAPTPLARENLVAESVDPRQIVVTGNTVVDAAQMLVERGLVDQALPAGVPDDGRRIVLLTSHRRESWGKELEQICDAVADIAGRFDDVRIVYPVHMNPNVRHTVEERLAGIDRVHLTEPLDYFQFLSLLRRSYLVLTDSVGVQEDAPILSRRRHNTGCAALEGSALGWRTSSRPWPVHGESWQALYAVVPFCHGGHADLHLHGAALLLYGEPRAGTPAAPLHRYRHGRLAGSHRLHRRA